MPDAYHARWSIPYHKLPTVQGQHTDDKGRNPLRALVAQLSKRHFVRLTALVLKRPSGSRRRPTRVKVRNGVTCLRLPPNDFCVSSARSGPTNSRRADCSERLLALYYGNEYLRSRNNSSVATYLDRQRAFTAGHLCWMSEAPNYSPLTTLSCHQQYLHFKLFALCDTDALQLCLWLSTTIQLEYTAVRKRIRVLSIHMGVKLMLKHLPTPRSPPED
jgi:hypothetical protein